MIHYARIRRPCRGRGRGGETRQQQCDDGARDDPPVGVAAGPEFRLALPQTACADVYVGSLFPAGGPSSN